MCMWLNLFMVYDNGGVLYDSQVMIRMYIVDYCSITMHLKRAPSWQ